MQVSDYVTHGSDMTAALQRSKLNNKDLLTTDEVALYLDISPGTIRNWRVQRLGPQFIRLGPGKRAPIRYRRQAVENYVADMERQTNQR